MPLPREQLPTMRASLLRGRDWAALAARAAAEQLGPAAQRLSQERLQRMLRSFDLMCGMEEEAAAAAAARPEVRWKAGTAGAAAACRRRVCCLEPRLSDVCLPAIKRPTPQLPETVKVDAYRQVKPGVWEWWSTYTLQLNTEKAPEPVTSGGGSSAAAPGPGAAAAGNENQPRQPSNDGGAGIAPAAPVKGKRYRLLPLSESLQRTLPADGKLSVLFGGRACEAALHLPASETRWVSWAASESSARLLSLRFTSCSTAAHRRQAPPCGHPLHLPSAGTQAAWRRRCGSRWAAWRAAAWRCSSSSSAWTGRQSVIRRRGCGTRTFLWAGPWQCAMACWAATVAVVAAAHERSLGRPPKPSLTGFPAASV